MRKVFYTVAEDLEAALSWQAEIDRVKNGDGAMESDESALSERAKELRATYRKALASHQAKRDKDARPFYAMWDRALELYQAELTKEENLAAAKQVMELRSEVGKLAAAPPADLDKRPRGISAAFARRPKDLNLKPQSFELGELVFLGEIRGKPISLPENIMKEKHHWLHSTMNGLFACYDGGAYSIDFSQTNGPVIVNGRALQRVNGWGWKGTLDPRQQLEYQFAIGGNDTIKNVVDFETGVNDGSLSGSLLALKKTGELELRLLGLELHWDFESWAKNKRFTAIALDRTKGGITGGALVLDSEGYLHAFDDNKLYEVPDFLRTKMIDVCASLIGGGMGAITATGEVWVQINNWNRFSDGKLANSWKKIPDSILRGRAPIRQTCGPVSGAVQFSDNSWALWQSEDFRPVFQNLTDGSKFEELQHIYLPGNGTEFVAGIRSKK